MLDGSGVKAIPGSISTPTSGSLPVYKNKKIKVAKWGSPKKYLKKTSPMLIKRQSSQ